ncbi:hypothetical protein [Accumulibacter sp.]|uniref:hypothetical protein n=1 Tax=Accumulibacter sp. TaxID=2053492 RepID=UPI00261A9090|nr:hypothetical protein [Accumulibacter sp.]
MTLSAARDININAVMTASGTSSMVMNTGTANGGDSAVADGTIKVGFAPGEANGFAGRVGFPGRSGNDLLTINGQDYTVINSLGTSADSTISYFPSAPADRCGWLRTTSPTLDSVR